MLKIYCVHPISGCSGEEVYDYYVDIKQKLDDIGYDVFVPMYGKSSLRTEKKFKAQDYRTPITCNHAIYTRDKWMVNQSDVILANFTGAQHVSIGSMMELAWSSDKGKHVIVVMEKDNVHRHAFVLESANIVFETLEEALSYLEDLSLRSIE